MSHCPINKFQIACCLCPKFCFSIDALETHLAVDHFNSDPFQCERCCSNGRPSKFPTESAVKRHYIEEHRMEKFYFRTWVTREIEANRIAIRKCLDKCIQAALGQRGHVNPSSPPFAQVASPGNCLNRGPAHNSQCLNACAGAAPVLCTNQCKDVGKPAANDVITIGEEECTATAAKKKKCSQMENVSPSQSDTTSEPSEKGDVDSDKEKLSSDQIKSTWVEKPLAGAVPKAEITELQQEITETTSRTSPFTRCTARDGAAAPPPMLGNPVAAAAAAAMASLHRAAMHHHHYHHQNHNKLSRTATLGPHKSICAAAAVASQERKRKHHFNEL